MMCEQQPIVYPPGCQKNLMIFKKFPLGEGADPAGVLRNGLERFYKSRCIIVAFLAILVEVSSHTKYRPAGNLESAL